MSLRASFSSFHLSTRNFSFARQPSTNLTFSSSITASCFLPMALRSLSDSPRVKPPSRRESNITCSWYTVTPYVSFRYVSMSGWSYAIGSRPCLRAMNVGM